MSTTSKNQEKFRVSCTISAKVRKSYRQKLEESPEFTFIRFSSSDLWIMIEAAGEASFRLTEA